jgi:Zn finger protein HypA/HybF involved in hydrogenase expression
MSKQNEHDWPEDFHLENGNYTGHCLVCKAEFIGRKRRVYCKKCTTEEIYADIARKINEEFT